MYMTMECLKDAFYTKLGMSLGDYLEFLYMALEYLEEAFQIFFVHSSWKSLGGYPKSWYISCCLYLDCITMRLEIVTCLYVVHFKTVKSVTAVHVIKGLMTCILEGNWKVVIFVCLCGVLKCFEMLSLCLQ